MEADQNLNFDPCGSMTRGVRDVIKWCARIISIGTDVGNDVIRKFFLLVLAVEINLIFPHKLITQESDRHMARQPSDFPWDLTVSHYLRQLPVRVRHTEAYFWCLVCYSVREPSPHFLRYSLCKQTGWVDLTWRIFPETDFTYCVARRPGLLPHTLVVSLHTITLWNLFYNQMITNTKVWIELFKYQLTKRSHSEKTKKIN